MAIADETCSYAMTPMLREESHILIDVSICFYPLNACDLFVEIVRNVLKYSLMCFS